MDGAAAQRFIADCMLGRLAKWLRALGYDTAYDRAIGDTALVARALREGRVLLTRDTRLVQRRALKEDGAAWLLVASDRPEEQLAQVVRERVLSPDPDRFLSRCLRCNEPTGPASPEEVRGEVPSYVLRTQERFSRCPACARIYWRATHVDGLLETLRRAARTPN